MNSIVNFDSPANSTSNNPHNTHSHSHHLNSLLHRPAPLQYDDRQFSLTSIINAAAAAIPSQQSATNAYGSFDSSNMSHFIHPSQQQHNQNQQHLNQNHNQQQDNHGNGNNGINFPPMFRDISLTSINVMEFTPAPPISPPALPFRGLSGTLFPDVDGDITLLPNLRGLSDFQMTQLTKDDDIVNTPSNLLNDNFNNINNLNSHHASNLNNNNNNNNSGGNHSSNSSTTSDSNKSPISVISSVHSNSSSSLPPVYPSMVMPQKASSVQLQSSSPSTSVVPPQYSYSYPNLNEDLLPPQDMHYRKRHRLEDAVPITSTTSVSIASHGSPISLDSRIEPIQGHGSDSPTLPPASRSNSAQSSPTHPQSMAKRSTSPSDDGLSEKEKEFQKKMKHQLTDRQRRAKIKESMDQLKSLLPVEKEKADQATVIAESVQYVKSLKDEIEELRKKITEMEVSSNDRSKNGRMDDSVFRSLVGSPLENVQHGLNGAGVSYWRIGLDCRLLEVNVVFEMLTGYSRSELIGTVPCRAPLYASTHFLPKAYMRYFANNGGMNAACGKTVLENTAKNMEQANDVHTKNNINNAHSEKEKEKEKTEKSDLNAKMQEMKKKQLVATAPLFPNSTIANFPIVPQSELQSFFPAPSAMYKQDQNTLISANHLLNHLISLPPTHVLKLLTRLNTTYGDTLELIQTISLVRTPDGLPDYILSLTTPDSRRLVKPSALLNRAASLEPTVDTSCGLVG